MYNEINLMSELSKIIKQDLAIIASGVAVIAGSIGWADKQSDEAVASTQYKMTSQEIDDAYKTNRVAYLAASVGLWTLIVSGACVEGRPQEEVERFRQQ